MANRDDITPHKLILKDILHELNQPLSTIANYAATGLYSMEEKPDPDPAELTDIFRKILAETYRTGDIARKLQELDLQRPP